MKKRKVTAEDVLFFISQRKKRVNCEEIGRNHNPRITGSYVHKLTDGKCEYPRVKNSQDTKRMVKMRADEKTVLKMSESMRPGEIMKETGFSRSKVTKILSEGRAKTILRKQSEINTKAFNIDGITSFCFPGCPA